MLGSVGNVISEQFQRCQPISKWLSTITRMPVLRGDGPVRWPPRSPDLSTIDYFLRGHLKVIIYETPVDSIEDAVARVSIAAVSVRESLETFANHSFNATKHVLLT
ncbi:hypothetical protein AVEN_55563-1, partial [Araneus ventricosus]